MHSEESRRKAISSVPVATANIIVLSTQRNQLCYRLIILSKAKLLRLKATSRFSAKTTPMFMLYATAATIEPCFAKTALTKNTLITLTPAAKLTKRAYRISLNKTSPK
jgi:hypothetical protein